MERTTVSRDALIEEINRRKRVEEELTREIAERKRVEETLRASEDRMRAILDNTVDGIITIDSQGIIIAFNRAAERIFGYSSVEAVGQNVKILMPEPYQREHDRYIETYLHTGQAKIIGIGREAAGLHKDGTILPLELAVSELVSGEQRMFTGIIRDITERKWADAELKQRTEALARSNAELEQFAYVASHDLQEPLRMVASYVQLLARRYQGQLDADADEFIAFAVDGANRMKRLIQDLLTYSRVGTRGKVFKPANCQEVLEQALANLKVAIEESRAMVTYDPLPSVLGDDGQLIQLFQNLIGNAIKFRGQEPPHIHVTAKAEVEGGEWLFSVSDNGIGIAPEFAERIFVIFQRLHGVGE